MGESKRRQISDSNWLKSQNECAFCGGAPESVDHFPSRVLFRNRQWPEGYRFAACLQCNKKTADDEPVMAFIAIASIMPGEMPTHMPGIVRFLKNNRQDILKEWNENRITRNQVKNAFRKRFDQEVSDILIETNDGFIWGPLTQKSINAFMRKLTQALFKLHTGKRLVNASSMVMIDKMRPTAVETANSFMRLLPNLAETKRSSIDLSDQFTYRYNVNAEDETLAALVEFPFSQFLYFLLATNREIEAVDRQSITTAGGIWLS